MANLANKAYSSYSEEANRLLGTLIHNRRIEQKIKASELAERAGISRDLLYRVEKGDMRCGIGSVFEVAAIVGIELFGMDQKALKKQLAQSEEKLQLLPKSVHKPKRVLVDDF